MFLDVSAHAMPPPKREGCARRFPPLYFSMGALLDFCRCFLSTREGQKSGAWELLQVFVFCNIPVLVARYRTSCEKMFPRLSFSVYRTARGRSELIPCISLKNHLTLFKLDFGDFFSEKLSPSSYTIGVCNIKLYTFVQKMKIVKILIQFLKI